MTITGPDGALSRTRAGRGRRGHARAGADGPDPRGPAGRPGGAGRPRRPSPSTSRSCQPWSPTAAGGHTARTGTGSPSSGAAAASTSPRRSEIRQLVQHVRANVVPRRNSRGGRSAAEHLIAALRCLYKHAEEDGLINPADNPARKVDKPRRLPSTRRAVAGKRLAEINQAAAATGDDPDLDTLLLRLHTETACRRGGALALRPQDLDPEQCLIQLREKGETVRWQPVSPTLMAALAPARPGTTCAPGREAAAVPQRPADHLPPI